MASLNLSLNHACNGQVITRIVYSGNSVIPNSSAFPVNSVTVVATTSIFSAFQRPVTCLSLPRPRAVGIPQQLVRGRTVVLAHSTSGIPSRGPAGRMSILGR